MLFVGLDSASDDKLSIGVVGRRRVKLGEEAVGDRGAAALGAPHDLAAAVVGDQRQVAMAAAPRDLVDGVFIVILRQQLLGLR